MNGFFNAVMQHSEKKRNYFAIDFESEIHSAHLLTIKNNSDTNKRDKAKKLNDEASHYLKGFDGSNRRKIVEVTKYARDYSPKKKAKK